MAQSLNTRVDLAEEGTSYQGIGSYGKILIGDKAFEFYNDRKVEDYIQIPWEEVDYVAASVMFKGKWIPRFVIFTKRSGRFIFSSRNPKQLLRAVNKYIPRERMLHSLSFFQVLKRAFNAKFRKKKKE